MLTSWQDWTRALRRPESRSVGRRQAWMRRMSRLVRGKGPGAMRGSTIVPHHQVANAPGLGVDELPLGGVLDEVAQEGARLRHLPAQDAARVRGEIERLAPRGGGGAHQALAHRPEALALLVGEGGGAEPLARGGLGVVAEQGPGS